MLKEKCPTCGQLLSLSTLAATMFECAGCQAAFVDPKAQSIALLTRGDAGPRQTGEVPLTPEFKKRFFLTRVLGSGAMGTVVEGYDKTKDNRKVAIKFLMRVDKEAILERFVREARSLTKAEHPSLMRIFEVGEMGAHPYIVTEYLGGGTLRDKLKRVKVIPFVNAAEITCDILAALGSCHRAGFIHRDIKPENIMFTDDGKAKVVDLGLAKEAGGESLTEDGVALGTPLYMSPEQVTGEQVATGSDVYSVALMLYEMLAGKHPFIAPSLGQILDHHLRTMPKPIHEVVPTLPAELGMLITACLQKTLDRRLAGADDFARRLARIAGIEANVPPGPEPGPLPEPAPPRKTGPSKAAIHSMPTPLPGPAKGPRPRAKPEAPGVGPVLEPAPAATAPPPAPPPPAPAAPVAAPAPRAPREPEKPRAAAPAPAPAATATTQRAAAPAPAHVRTQEYGALPSPSAGVAVTPAWQKAAAGATAVGVALLVGLQLLGPRPPAGGGRTGASASATAAPAPTPTGGGAGAEYGANNPGVVSPPPTRTTSGSGGGTSSGGERASVTATESDDQSEMVTIKGGAFKMGTAKSMEFDCAQHEVRVSDFELDRREVTNARFRAFVKATGHSTTAEKSKRGPVWNDGIDGKDDLPVVQVSWEDAQAFCEWAHKRLPTEAEWEFAARARMQADYGEVPEPPVDREVCGLGPAEGPKTVGSMNANGLKLYDMLGNVREWVGDHYDRDYYKVSPERDPAGPENGANRVVRGGSWLTPPPDLLVYKRKQLPPKGSAADLGFRCARTLSR